MALVMNRPLELKAKLDAAANALASVTYAAVTGHRHHAVVVAWSYSAAPTGGKLTIKDGVTAVFEVDITAAGPGSIPLPPVRGTANTALVVELAAGGVAVTGKLNVAAFPEP